MNVTLTPDLEKFVRRQVKSGGYNSSSEVMRDALRLLKEDKNGRRERLRRVREAVTEGRASGVAGPLDLDDILSAAEEARAA